MIRKEVLLEPVCINEPDDNNPNYKRRSKNVEVTLTLGASSLFSRWAGFLRPKPHLKTKKADTIPIEVGFGQVELYLPKLRWCFS